MGHWRGHRHDPTISRSAGEIVRSSTTWEPELHASVLANRVSDGRDTPTYAELAEQFDGYVLMKGGSQWNLRAAMSLSRRNSPLISFNNPTSFTRLPFQRAPHALIAEIPLP